MNKENVKNRIIIHLLTLLFSKFPGGLEESFNFTKNINNHYNNELDRPYLHRRCSLKDIP